MALALGIDVGSVAVKVALVEAGGLIRGVWSRPILGHLGDVVASLIQAVPAVDADVRIGITGPIANLVYSGVEGSQRALLVAFLHQVKIHARSRPSAAPELPERSLLARLRPAEKLFLDLLPAGRQNH